MSLLNILLVLLVSKLAMGVKPVFDYSNNMRLVMLPSDTKLGSVIYRLRASDSDDNDYPLTFSVYGIGSILFFGTVNSKFNLLLYIL